MNPNPVGASNLFVDFASSHSRVLQVGSAAVGETNTAAGRNPSDGEIDAVEPAGVVVDAAAVQLQRKHVQVHLLFQSDTEISAEPHRIKLRLRFPEHSGEH